jgi:peptide-methionine (S)-S-oxide reductase
MAIEIAIFGGGCFWATEAVFQQIRGVKSTIPGYAGGALSYPTSEQVADGTTGHAEVVQLSFDPTVVSYRSLLELFFIIHDPTTLNRQGSDEGAQYRSVLFVHSSEQASTATMVMEHVARLWDQPLVTEVVSAPVFYAAEDYHQNYFKHNSHHEYCAMVVAPKVDKARQFFSRKQAA